MRLFIKAASSASTSESTQVFYDLFQTQSWATMMTFAQESARKSLFQKGNTSRSFSLFTSLSFKPRRLPPNLWTLIWTSCRRTFVSRFGKWKGWSRRRVQGRAETEVQDRALALGFARIARLRTRTEARIVKCVCYRWVAARGSRYYD